MERLKRMSVFAKVVEFGSFTAAARQLQNEAYRPSSRALMAKLEDELQLNCSAAAHAALNLHRSWKIYYQGCRRMLHKVQDVHEQLTL